MKKPGGSPAPPLRPFKESDLLSILSSLNDPEVWRTSGDIPSPFTEADAARYLETVLTPSPYHSPHPSFAIELEEELVGAIHLVLGDDVRRASANIPLWLGRKAWGKGLGSAALKSICEWGFVRFPDLHRIWGEPMAHNIGCIRALEKAGFRKEAVLRSSQIKAGAVYDSMLMSICRDSMPPAGLLRRDELAPPALPLPLPPSKLFSSPTVLPSELRPKAKRKRGAA